MLTLDNPVERSADADVDPGKTLLALALRDDGAADTPEREEVILRWLDLLPPAVSLPLAMRVKRLRKRLARLETLMETRLLTEGFQEHGGYVDRDAQVAYGMETSREWTVEDPEGLRVELSQAGLPRRVLDKAVPLRAVPNHAVLNSLMSDPVIPQAVRKVAQGIVRAYRTRKYGPPHLVAYPMGEHHDADADSADSGSAATD